MHQQSPGELKVSFLLLDFTFLLITDGLKKGENEEIQEEEDGKMMEREELSFPNIPTNFHLNAKTV